MTAGRPFRPAPLSLLLHYNITPMETMNGHAALQMAEAVTKAGGTFDISFFPFSRAKPQKGEVKLVTFRKCRMRKPLPHDKFDIDGKHFFLFLTENDEPKTCYRSLIRAMSFSTDNKIKLIKWYE